MEENEIESILSITALSDSSRRIVVLRNVIPESILIPLSKLINVIYSAEMETLSIFFYSNHCVETKADFKMIQNTNPFLSLLQPEVEDPVFKVMDMFARVKHFTERTTRKFPPPPHPQYTSTQITAC